MLLTNLYQYTIVRNQKKASYATDMFLIDKVKIHMCMNNYYTYRLQYLQYFC